MNIGKRHRQQFERVMMRHFNSAYNLARWLVRDEHIAEDIVQNAYMRAFEAYASFRGEKSQAWILTIVRNTAYNWLNKQKRESNLVVLMKHCTALMQTTNPQTTPINLHRKKWPA